jgi:hypothetical protein
MIKYFYFVLINACLFSLQIHAQILDDSTKEVYGYHSTRYFTEQNIFRDDTLKSIEDTSFNVLIQRYDKLILKDNIFQNLGNLGTASKAIYWEQPNRIGFDFGYHVYDQYATNVLNTRFYDTKSPFTSMKYLQGGTGENSLNFNFNRSFDERFNFGFNLQRLTSVKQIGRKVQRDRNVDSWDFGFSAAYHSKNKRYTALSSFARFSSLVRETGGIRPDSSVFDQSELNLYDQSPVKMSDSARTIDDRTNFRFYHQFSLIKNNKLNLFHTYAYSNQYVGFNDKRLNNTTNGKTLFSEFVYPTFFLDTNNTVYRAQFKSYVNTFGLKTSLDKLRLRAFSIYENNEYQQIIKSNLLDNVAFNVVKFGTEADFYFNEKSFISLRTLNQVSLSANTNNVDRKINIINNNDFNYNVSFVSSFLKFGFDISKYSPSMKQIQYSSNNYQWINANLNPTTAQTLYLKLFKNIKKQKFELNISHSDIKNYVYFLDTAKLNSEWVEQIVVKQNTIRGFQLTTAEIVAGFNIFDKVFINSQARYTHTSGDTIYRVPKLFLSSLIYYQIKFTSNLALQIGFDVQYKSSYKADAYSVALQQFVVQNSFKAKSYTVVDAFVNLKIRRATVWSKVSQINQYLGQEVYFLTPYYPGMSMAFHFGVNWPFFD